MKLVLYGYWRSSSSYRVRLALAAKGVPYENVAVNLLEGKQRSAEHRARSPMGTVPCLIVDGKAVVESVAILELLEDLFPTPPLYPTDAFARARVRAMVEIINSGVQPLQNLLVLDHVSKEASARKDWATFFIARGLSAFEALMADNEKEGALGPFAYGSAIGAADVFLLPQLYGARRFGVDLEPFSRVLRAERSALAVEALRAAAPENQADAVASG